HRGLPESTTTDRNSKASLTVMVAELLRVGHIVHFLEVGALIEHPRHYCAPFACASTFDVTSSIRFSQPALVSVFAGSMTFSTINFCALKRVFSLTPWSAMFTRPAIATGAFSRRMRLV